MRLKEKHYKASVGIVFIPSDMQSTVKLNFQGHSEDRSATVTNGEQIPDWRAYGVAFDLVNSTPPVCVVDPVITDSTALPVVPPDAVRVAMTISKDLADIMAAPATLIFGPSCHDLRVLVCMCARV
jgi:hypothetical protein